MILGFSTRLGWGREWKSCMANSKDWRSEKLNAIELNCNVVKKVTTPLFQVYTPFLAKNFVPPPSDAIYGRSYPPSPFNKGRGPTMTIQLLIRVITSKGTTTEQCFKILSLEGFSNLIIEAKETPWRISGIDKINCKID